MAGFGRDGLPVLLAALEAVGANPAAAHWTDEELEAARNVLRDVDRIVGEHLGEVVVVDARLRCKSEDIR